MNFDILARNLLILASAGSGKTYQLSNRVVGLVAGRGVDPLRIVALTFTRKAAGEFTDAVLMKLADAASDGGRARGLEDQIGLSGADWSAALERVVRVLPRMSFGTIDGFFARVVRAFQYEFGLTGGVFRLLEGAAQAEARDAILAGLLGGDAADGAEFGHAFRRTLVGRDGVAVAEPLRKYVTRWHGWIGGWEEVMDPARVFTGLPEVEEWGNRKNELIERARAGLAHVVWTDNRQQVAMEKLLDTFGSYVIGGGQLNVTSALKDALIQAVGDDGDVLSLRYQKDFEVRGELAVVLREMVLLAAACELAAAVVRTQAVIGMVGTFDVECGRKLRRRGQVGFDDLKRLMSRWVTGEEARVVREAIDFRLDERYDHWLLDEFQDTGPAEWHGLLPLLDEAAMGEDGGLFVVGDRKQAIYGWRGGDVRLFDEVLRRYNSHGGGLEIGTMPESRRSCAAVLELVNAVCGDTGLIGSLFGDGVAAR